MPLRPRASERRRRVASLFLTSLACLAAPAGAGRLVTVDGRLLEIEGARETADGYRLLFRHGEILCPAERIAEVELEADMSGYEPADERERALLALGHVRFRGRWMSKARYLELAAEDAAARRERIAELERHADFEQGYVGTSRHFLIRTNTSPELLEQYAELLDAFYDTMAERLGLGSGSSAAREKMQVNIHRSQADFRTHHDVDENTFGLFSQAERSLSFFHEYEEPGRSAWIALHECTHSLTFLLEPELQAPVWINEAIADYYGSVSRERAPNGRLRLEPGAVLAGRVLTVQQAIRRGEALRLSELVLLGPLEFGPFEYAHAWSLVYFLNQSPQHRRGFEDFQRRLYSLRGIDYERVEAQTWTGFAKRVDPEDTLALLLGRLRLDAAELEREWKSFVSALAVDGPEARLERGYELVRSGTALGQPELRERALADLIAAVEGGLRDPRAWVGLGWIRIHEGRRQQAAAEFRRAVAMDPLNARYRFDLAYALSGLREPEGHADGPALDLLEARRQFGLCTELDPENERYRSVYAALVAQLEESD